MLEIEKMGTGEGLDIDISKILLKSFRVPQPEKDYFLDVEVC